MNEETEDHLIHTEFSFPYALDYEGFFRRRCSECGLHFKVKMPPDMLSTILAPAFRQVGMEYGVSLEVAGSENQQEKSGKLVCPYCGHEDEPSNFATEKLLEVVRIFALREYIHPLINDSLEDFVDEFGRNRQSQRNSFFSIDINFQHEPSPLPVRPMADPELPDMNRVSLGCCHKEIKIKYGWFGMIYCPYCSENLILI